MILKDLQPRVSYKKVFQRFCLLLMLGYLLFGKSIYRWYLHTFPPLREEIEAEIMQIEWEKICDSPELLERAKYTRVLAIVQEEKYVLYSKYQDWKSTITVYPHASLVPISPSTVVLDVETYGGRGLGLPSIREYTVMYAYDNLYIEITVPTAQQALHEIRLIADCVNRTREK